jgi:hypothetical protein
MELAIGHLLSLPAVLIRRNCSCLGSHLAKQYCSYEVLLLFCVATNLRRVILSRPP